MMATLCFGAIQAASGNETAAIDSAKIYVVLQVAMAIGSGMPHPALLKTMGFTEFTYTWLYNSTNILCQNFQKLYHPVPGEKTVEVERTNTTTIRTEGAATAK